MSGLFDPSEIFNQIILSSTEALYKRVEGIEIIKCAKCQEPVRVADSRPKLLTDPDTALKDLMLDNGGEVEIALCCPDCCSDFDWHRRK